MKRLFVLLSLVVLLCTINMGVLATEELKVLIWTDYLHPDLVEKFESETGVELDIQTYESVEQMYQYLSDEENYYDVLVTAEFFLSNLKENDFIQILKKEKLNNFNNISPWFTNLAFDPNNQYTIPYTYVFMGLAYDPIDITAEEATLQNIFEPIPKLEGKISFYPDTRGVISMALRYMGKSINSTDEADLELVKMLLSNLKANSLAGDWKLNRTVHSPAIAIENDQVDLAIYYASQPLVDIISSVFEFENPIKTKIPVEGGFLGLDNLMVCKDAQNEEMAYKFIDFLLVPENAAINVPALGVPMPIIGVKELLPPELANDPTLYPSNDEIRMFESYEPLSPEELQLYTDIWESIN